MNDMASNVTFFLMYQFCFDLTFIIECQRPLGMQNHEIKDWQITVRPYRYYRNKPKPGRLLPEGSGGAGKAWKPYWSYRGLWFQVYLHDEYTWVTRIATQGSVTKYKLLYWGYRVRTRWYREIGQRYAKVKNIV